MYDFKTVEASSRKIWKKKEKEITRAIKGETGGKLFSFLEGPPTANAPPGLHHLEVRTFKDIICKFRFMQGFKVPRKGGWDCHGLPVEVQVEKALKLNSKKDIEKYGTGKFIEKARESVFSNIKEWEKSTKELDYWIDMKEPYVTLDNNYIESVWWSLKELYGKGLLYEGHKVVPFCPRCGTPLSSHEVAQGYKDVKEDSVYVAFKVKNEKKTYILAWTTTPWTLPGNVALAVGGKIDYVKVKLPDGDFLILGKDRLDVLEFEYEIVEEFKGKDLEGVEYEPLFDIEELKNENSHKVILADFVTTDDGTGVVHTAVMYGEDDYNVGIEKGLPAVHTVGEDGKFLDIVPHFKGKFVKEAEKDIIENLKSRKLLLKKEKIEHSYPHCWRCDTPLLYYAINSWFVAASKLRERMVELNEEINWYPEHIKGGRFGNWLEGAKDWALSRFKFWGTPLPVWKCSCGEMKIIGSVEELKKESVKKISGKIDLHKPWIDDVKLKCSCGEEMARVSDVIDCWYDSGSVSFAQFHYPFENKDLFKKRFPYDFISEAIDQTRGWFYTLHVLATALFDKPAYKNVICAGHIVDENGEKMSKSKGNIIKPGELIDKAGVDAVRLQFCTSDAGNFKRFSYELMKENVIGFLNVLYNTNVYYNSLGDVKLKKRVEDKWILSRLNSLIKDVSDGLENYSIDKPMNKIINFVVNDFSRGYIKMTRDREDTMEVIGEVLEKVSILLAPFAPYISEHIYSQFNKESVHLSSWPGADKRRIDEELENDFEVLLEVIEKGLAARDKSSVGLKWPLAKARVEIDREFNMGDEISEIVKNQLNVKDIEVVAGKVFDVTLDTNLTPELEAEGYARNIARQVQSLRKKKGLVKENKIDLIVVGDSELVLMLEDFSDFLKERVNAKKVMIGSNFKGKGFVEDKFRVKDKEIKLFFKKS